MIPFTITFLFGIFGSLFWNRLPPCWITGVLLLFLGGVSILTNSKLFKSLSFVVFGFFYVSLHVQFKEGALLPLELVGKTQEITGVVTDFPNYRTNYAEVYIKTIYPSPVLRYKVYWKNPPKNLKVGQKWFLHLKLKRPNGHRNPGSNDSEKFFFFNQIGAVGSVLKTPEPVLVGEHFSSFPLLRMREFILNKITDSLEGRPFIGPIVALVIGSTHLISQEQWEVLRKSGTAHLMAISGMHIGLVAGILYWVSRFIWRRVDLFWRKMSLPIFSGIFSFGGALIYGILAGLSIPTQRALIMLVVIFFGVYSKRFIKSWDIFFFALCLVLVWDPLSILSIGFWLSFGAVLTIFYSMQGRMQSNSIWDRHLKLHWVLFIAFFPLLLFFFGSVSWSSPFANIVAVPWVTFSVVPLALIGTLCFPIPFIGEGILWLSERSLAILWPFLQFCAEVKIPVLEVYRLSPLVFGLSMVGAIWMLAPIGMPGRWCGMLCWLPLFFPPEDSVSQGMLRMTVLDVGQGLSLVLETKRHTLVYDTGPKIGQDLDAGAHIIGPFLKYRGKKAIDMLLISHPDADHIGGASSLLRDFRVQNVLISDPNALESDRSIPCRRGMAWEWEGVHFEIIHPIDINEKKRNEHSCVLQVKIGKHRVLLTGDIGSKSELTLVQSYGQELKSDILLVPHHGSQTSSSQEFLGLVQPRYAVLTTGYQNRYRHPHQVVVERYRSAKVELLDTMTSGAITFLIKPGDNLLPPKEYRVEHRHFWNLS